MAEQGKNELIVKEKLAMQDLSQSSSLIGALQYGGFNPIVLGEKIQDLTKIITQLMPETSLRSLHMHITADGMFPKVEVDTNYDNTPEINLDIFYPENDFNEKPLAELRVGRHSGPMPVPIGVVLLKDLQEYVRTVLPNKKATLLWSPTVKPGEPVPDEEPIREDRFLELTQAEFNKFPQNQYVLCAGDSSRLSLLVVPQDDMSLGYCCHIYGIDFIGEPKKVEDAVGLTTELIKKQAHTRKMNETTLLPFVFNFETNSPAQINLSTYAELKATGKLAIVDNDIVIHPNSESEIVLPRNKGKLRGSFKGFVLANLENLLSGIASFMHADRLQDRNLDIHVEHGDTSIIQDAALTAACKNYMHLGSA